jgi:hypothetical protein
MPNRLTMAAISHGARSAAPPTSNRTSVNDLPQSALDLESECSFAGHLQAAMHGLRRALSDLLTSMGDDPHLPQEVSRRYNINKNLSWKISRIINSTDSYDLVPHVPGRGGMKILCQAFDAAGVDSARTEAVQRAFEAYNEMIRLHVGDRATLELYVGSRRPGGIHSEQLEDKRRLAYQGNSAIWGVQVRLGVTLRAIVANDDDPEFVDIADVGGFFGFRRLRPTVSWPVLQQRVLADDFQVEREVRVPIDPAHSGDGPPLMPEFCSQPLPETRTILDHGAAIHELCEGPVGMTAAIDVAFGTVSKHVVPVHGDSSDSVGEHYCRIDTPVETVQFDLLVHRDLPFELPPRSLTCSRLHGQPTFPLSRSTRFHLPGTSTVQDLGSTREGISTPLLRDYPRLAESTCEALGQDIEAFHAYRIIVKYPPMPTVMVLVHPLAAQA